MSTKSINIFPTSRSKKINTYITSKTGEHHQENKVTDDVPLSNESSHEKSAVTTRTEMEISFRKCKESFQVVI